MRKTLCILLALLLTAALFSACSKTDPTVPGGQSGTDNPGKVETTGSIEPGGKETLPPQRPLEDRFADSQCAVLAKIVIPAESVNLSGNTAENVTVLTLRLIFPDWDTQRDCGSLRLLDAAGVQPQQTWTAWKNDIDIMGGLVVQTEIVEDVCLFVLEGDVDTAGLKLKLRESYGKTEVEIPVAESVDDTVYGALHEAFPHDVVQMQGRTYIVVNNGAWSMDGNRLARSIIFVPLENGLGQTIDKAGFTVEGPDTDGIETVLYVNEYDEYDHRGSKDLQQAVTVVVSKSDTSDADLGHWFKDAAIVTDDGAGNPVRLVFG